MKRRALVLLAAALRVPHLYDMHSSLPQQLLNFEFTNNRIVVWLFRALERWTLHTADAVITIFGFASSIRTASSCGANPPKTTEWIAPSRAQASMATAA